MKSLFSWWRDGFRTATRTGILAGANDAFGVLTDGKVSIDDKPVLDVETTAVATVKAKPKRKPK